MIKLIFLVLSIVIGVILYPYRLSVMHIITGVSYVRTDCGDPVAPKLNLKEVRSCDLVNMKQEPCVIRNAVPSEQIDAFLEENGDHKFSLKRITNDFTAIGNPLGGTYNHYSSPDRLLCSMKDLINRDPRCIDYYTGFKSLNYTNYLPLNSSGLDISSFTRTDFFLGLAAMDRVTAHFHSNNFEESQTLQVAGEKIWLLMEPKDMYGLFGAYTLGAYNAIWNICVKDLELVELQTVRTGRGDILSFPKAWAHHIYSREGPNIMINFRNYIMSPLTSVRDAVAGAAMFVDFLRARFIWKKPFVTKKYCSEEMYPSNFGRGHPNELDMWKNSMYDLDMRCVELFSPMIMDHSDQLATKVKHDENVDRDIYEQLLKFLNVE